MSSKEEHVPDYLSRRKDIILFAPIVPHFAETLNLLAFVAPPTVSHSGFNPPPTRDRKSVV